MRYPIQRVTYTNRSSWFAMYPTGGYYKPLANPYPSRTHHWELVTSGQKWG